MACTFARDYYEQTGKLLKKHRVSNPGCINYEDWKLERIVADSKHCPIKQDNGDEAPF